MPNPNPTRDELYDELHAARAARDESKASWLADVNRFRLAVLELGLSNSDLSAELQVAYITAKDLNAAAAKLGQTGEASRPRRGKNMNNAERAFKRPVQPVDEAETIELTEAEPIQLFPTLENIDLIDYEPQTVSV